MPTLTIPAFDQDRGPRRFNKATGSSVSLPVNYCEDQCTDTGEGCSEISYVVRSVDMNINELINCRTSPVATISLKTRVDADYSEAASYTLIVNALRDIIANLANPCAVDPP